MTVKKSWSFNGYTWPVNPSEDSGWISELVENELVPIGARSSRIQHGGIKSRRRRISGTMYGPGAAKHRENMENWLRSRATGSLQDHFGRSNTARLISFQKKAVRDVRGLKFGYEAWQYDAEFIMV